MAKVKEAIEESIEIEVSPRIIKVGDVDVLVQKLETDRLEFSFWTDDRHSADFEVGDNELATAILLSVNAEQLEAWVDSFNN